MYGIAVSNNDQFRENAAGTCRMSFPGSVSEMGLSYEEDVKGVTAIDTPGSEQGPAEVSYKQKSSVTTEKTPIEIALAVDDEGYTTARKLYDWLELGEHNYARWIKTNLLENSFAEEGKDFSSLTKKSRKGIMGRPTNDYRLTANFAKKLAMKQHSVRGEQARIYFLGCEKLAEALLKERERFLVERTRGTTMRLSLTDEIKNSGENVRLNGHAYSTYTNLVYKTALGAGLRQLQAERGLSKKDKLRNHLTPEELEAVCSIEQMIAGLLRNGKRYDKIKAICEDTGEEQACESA